MNRFTLDQIAAIACMSPGALQQQFLGADVAPNMGLFTIDDLLDIAEGSRILNIYWQVASELPNVFLQGHRQPIEQLRDLVAAIKNEFALPYVADLKLATGLGVTYFFQAAQAQIDLSAFEIQRAISLIQEISSEAAQRRDEFAAEYPEYVREITQAAVQELENLNGT